MTEKEPPTIPKPFLYYLAELAIGCLCVLDFARSFSWNGRLLK